VRCAALMQIFLSWSLDVAVVNRKSVIGWRKVTAGSTADFAAGAVRRDSRVTRLASHLLMATAQIATASAVCQTRRRSCDTPRPRGASGRGDQLNLRGAIRDASNPTLVMDRIVQEALRLIPSANGALVELEDGDSLSCVCGAGILSRAVGTRVRLDGSLSGLAFQTGTTLRCDDSERDERADRAAFRRTGSRSAISVPLRRGRDPVGAFSVSAPKVAAFDERDVATLTGLAEFITAAITTTSELDRVTDDLLTTLEVGKFPSRADEADRVSTFVANVLHPGIANDVEAAQRIEKVLRSGEFAILFQPVVDLGSGRLVGVEALARFLPGPYRPPNEWFEEAHRVGRGVELEHAAVREALSHIARLPSECFIAINVGPRAIESREIAALLESFDAGRVVLELTEHFQIDDYSRLRRALMNLREQGVRLAIDDAGSGYSGLSHIVQLAPDIIKIDIELVRGIDFDPIRRSLVTSIVAFGPEIGASVVAEGIETRGEFDTLRGLGVDCGQGYFLGQPGPPEMLDVHGRPEKRRVRRVSKAVLSGRRDATS
jgi:EAL domain-containing protein (putative c-di-GMP-specific phosphodiesterase class I)